MAATRREPIDRRPTTKSCKEVRTVRVAINCDLGESYGRWELGADEQVMNFITAANIACGLHAGDPSRIAATVQMALSKGVGIGAHPSYPDLQGFGRRFMDMTPTEVRDMVTYQLGAIQAFARVYGGRMEHVKPHGALYNRCADDETTARAVIEAVRDVDSTLVVVVLAGSTFEEVARAMNVPFAREVFADRGYDARGRLVSRRLPGSVVEDPKEIVERVWTMVSEQRVKAVTGEWITVAADTVCVHGDTPGAVHIAQRLRDTLVERGAALLTIGQLIAERTRQAAG